MKGSPYIIVERYNKNGKKEVSQLDWSQFKKMTPEQQDYIMVHHQKLNERVKTYLEKRECETFLSDQSLKSLMRQKIIIDDKTKTTKFCNQIAGRYLSTEEKDASIALLSYEADISNLNNKNTFPTTVKSDLYLIGRLDKQLDDRNKIAPTYANEKDITYSEWQDKLSELDSEHLQTLTCHTDAARIKADQLSFNNARDLLSNQNNEKEQINQLISNTKTSTPKNIGKQDFSSDTNTLPEKKENTAETTTNQKSAEVVETTTHQGTEEVNLTTASKNSVEDKDLGEQSQDKTHFNTGLDLVLDIEDNKHIIEEAQPTQKKKDVPSQEALIQNNTQTDEKPGTQCDKEEKEKEKSWIKDKWDRAKQWVKDKWSRAKQWIEDRWNRAGNKSSTITNNAADQAQKSESRKINNKKKVIPSPQINKTNTSYQDKIKINNQQSNVLQK